MHYGGHLREAFEQWVESGMPDTAIVEVQYVEREWPAERLLGRMWHCSDIMPRDLCSQLDMPGGSSYAAAAQKLR